MPSPSDSASSHSPISDELARKRARDRKSQRAMRDRQKYCIDELQQRCAYLSQALASETEALQALLRSSAEETDRLKAENQRLRSQLEHARYVGLNGCLERFSSPSSVPLLSQLPVPRPMSQRRRSSASVASMDQPRNAGLMIDNKEQIVSQPACLAVPWESEPTCISDRILQSYVEARRASMSDVSHIVWAEQPDINALLTPTKSTEARSVSNVVSDILLSYHEINTLPKKVAALYIMHKLVNWLIYRTQSMYDQMPEWLRPKPMQLQVRHPAWIDRIPWPHARTYLIMHPEISFDDFAMVYSSTFEVSWPYDSSHIVMPSTDCSHVSVPSGLSCQDHCVSLNPVYEQHLRQLKNWTVGEKFRRKFPELSAIIDQDNLFEFES